MFQFPTFAFLTEWQAFNLPGCPIRKFRDQLLFAHPPNLSQLITSFFASESQGIHRLPLLTFFFRAHMRLLYYYLKHVSDWYIFKACSICYFIALLSIMSKIFLPLPWGVRSVWRITDSNRWPSACKADALASWANPPNLIPFVVPGRVELPTSTLSV